MTEGMSYPDEDELKDMWKRAKQKRAQLGPNYNSFDDEPKVRLGKDLAELFAKSIPLDELIADYEEQKNQLHPVTRAEIEELIEKLQTPLPEITTH